MLAGHWLLPPSADRLNQVNGADLLGPALIGWLAEAIGLTWTLAAPIPLLFVVVVQDL